MEATHILYARGNKAGTQSKGECKVQADNDSKLLMGAAAIAAYLGITRRQAYKLAYCDGMPILKLGGTVAALPSDINAWLEGKRTAA